MKSFLDFNSDKNSNVNLLTFQIVLAEHNDHLTVARILLNSETTKLQLGLTVPSLPVITNNFTGKPLTQ